MLSQNEFINRLSWENKRQNNLIIFGLKKTTSQGFKRFK
ncbi:hypothetical protein cce_4734 [Crocosphaera subtropica ATCC 51142]|uniref:Uncharacterized protein n=1 Tax=Crocosphaera subtropica (strain ATCC 51142 / BH68) TaxID=43989 RepID=B1WWF4_CROS5|nr:hypothetical protein cce_4734 [Crocosphaera subtropica ATCC 51142]